MKFLLTIFIGYILMASEGCSGWSVAGYELYPNLAENDSFFEIIDQDSVVHRYASEVLVDRENWCYIHEIWEQVRAE